MSSPTYSATNTVRTILKRRLVKDYLYHKCKNPATRFRPTRRESPLIPYPKSVGSEHTITLLTRGRPLASATSLALGRTAAMSSGLCECHRTDSGGRCGNGPSSAAEGPDLDRRRKRSSGVEHAGSLPLLDAFGHGFRGISFSSGWSFTPVLEGEKFFDVFGLEFR